MEIYHFANFIRKMMSDAVKICINILINAQMFIK